MKVVILAGGFGTRISEESHLKPKPMIEIGGKPILWHIMKYYSEFGFHDFIICLGYKQYVVKEFFADYFLHTSDVTFDLIWSNPPIRVGKDVLHELLMTWLPRLNAGGTAYLVVQKNLGSDSLIPWLATQLGDGYEVSKYASSKGFRVIEVMKA